MIWILGSGQGCSQAVAAGAADAWLVPIMMKKGRPAHTLTVLSRPDQAAELRDIVLRRPAPSVCERPQRARPLCLGVGLISMSPAPGCRSRSLTETGRSVR